MQQAALRTLPEGALPAVGAAVGAVGAGAVDSLILLCIRKPTR